MLRKHHTFIVQCHKLLDLALTAVSFIGAYIIKENLLPLPLRGLLEGPNYTIVLLLIVIIWYLTLNGFNSYASYRKQGLGEILWKVFKAVTTGLLTLTLCLFIFKITDISRLLLGMFYLINLAVLGGVRIAVFNILTAVRKKGLNFRNILIVGTRQRAKEVIDAIHDHVGAGYNIIGCLGLDHRHIGMPVHKGVKIIGRIEELEKILLHQVVDELIFSMQLGHIDEVDRYITVAEKLGVPVRIVPDWQLHCLKSHPDITSINIEEFMDIPTMTLRTTPLNQGKLFVKQFIDYTIAAVTLVPLLPAFLLIAAGIKLVSTGPVFFRQQRCSLYGRTFTVYKFRTMKVDAETRRKELEGFNEADGPVFKMRRDPRIIPFIGSFLRKTGLDELPQLINVLRGEMSLVGPRPPLPAEVENYDMWQRRRLSMKPGITCLWQITPCRNDVCFEDWMNMDLSYIDNWSLLLDFKILFKTARVVLTGAGR
jgi:exopolysaccharide biosynthesis polyprenyl glycosylphosphotransferase